MHHLIENLWILEIILKTINQLLFPQVKNQESYQNPFYSDLSKLIANLINDKTQRLLKRQTEIMCDIKDNTLQYYVFINMVLLTRK